MEYYTCKSVEEMVLVYMKKPFNELPEHHKLDWIKEFQNDPDVGIKGAIQAGLVTERSPNALRFLNR